MARTALEDFSKGNKPDPKHSAPKERTQPSSHARPTEGGKEKDRLAVIKLGAAGAVFVLALLIAGYNLGLFAGKPKAPAAPNLPPDETQAMPSKPPPTPGEVETPAIPNAAPQPARASGTN